MLSSLEVLIASMAKGAGAAGVRALVATPQDLPSRIYRAITRAQARFREYYADAHGPLESSFLDFQESLNRIEASVRPGTAPLTVAMLRGGPDAKWLPIGDAAIDRFLSILDEELRRDWLLDAILTGKETHHLVKATHESVSDLQRGLAVVTAHIGPDRTGAPIGAMTDAHNALLDRTKALLDVGKPKSAKALLQGLEQDLAMHAGTPQLRARLYNHLGSASMQLREYPAAIEYLGRVHDYQSADSASQSNIAAAKLLANDVAGSWVIAQQVIREDPESLAAWQVAVQAASTLNIQLPDPPAAVGAAKEYLVAAAHAALRRHDWTGARQLASKALSMGPRSHEVLLALAQAVGNSLAANEPPAGPEVVNWRSEWSLTARLADEAIGLLEGREDLHALATALTLRGVARRRLGLVADAVADLERASALDPEEREYLAHYASAVLEKDGPEAALFVISRHGDNRDLALFEVRARALGILERADELEAHCRECVESAIGTPRETDTRLLSAELLIDVGKLDTAAALAERIPDDEREWQAFVFRGRAAAAAGDNAKADTMYEAAIGSVPDDEERRGIRLEFAYVLGRRGDFVRALLQFELARVLEGPDSHQRLYMRTLYTAGQYERLAEALAAIGASDAAVPGWAEELAAFLAHHRDDVVAEIGHLERYIASQPDDIERAIQLGQAYMRRRETSKLEVMLTGLRSGSSLSPGQQVRIAYLSAHVGMEADAIGAAFRAYRAAPNDYEVQIGFVHLVFGLRGRGILPASTQVEGGTHVLLESAQGELIDYLILEEGPAEASRGEVLAGDAAVADLLGLHVGQTVTRHQGSISEKEYVVREIKPAPVFAFQQLLANHHRQFPWSTAFQAFKLSDDPSVRDFAEIIQGVEADARRSRAALEMHVEQCLPLGVLAEALGTDVPTVQRTLTSEANRRLMVESGTATAQAESRMAAAAMSDGGATVVMTHSAIVTLQQLDLLAFVAALPGLRIVPQALVDDLLEASDKWTRAAREGYRAIGPALHGGVQVREWSAEAARPVAEAAQELVAWVDAYCKVAPLPISATGVGDQARRELLGHEAFGALALAAERPCALFADDLGLRSLARAENGTAGFSTWGLIEAAMAAKVLDTGRHAELNLRLIEFQHHFLPVSAELLSFAFRRAGEQLNADVVRAIGRLSGPEVDLEGAVRVAAGLIKNVAVSGLGIGKIVMLSAACAEAVTTNRSQVRAIAAFTRALRGALKLLPLGLEEALQGVDVVVQSRRDFA